MKRLGLLLATFLLCAAAHAQTGYTNVTGTIAGYAGGSVVANWINNSTAPIPPNLQGASFPQQSGGAIDASGNFSLRLADVAVIQPTGSTWNITACAKGGAQPLCTTASIAITGTSQSVTSSFTSAPIPGQTIPGNQTVGGSGVYGGTVTATAFITPNTYFNQQVTSYTQIAAPPALTTVAGPAGVITTSLTGGTLPATTTYRLAATCADPSGGETKISTDTASTSTIATGAAVNLNSITVSSPTCPAGSAGWRLYMTAAAGSAGTEILYAPTCTALTTPNPLPGVCALGSPATITAIVTGTATIPATGTAYPRGNGASRSYPPFTALGTLATTNTGTLGLINYPAGFWNTLGKSLTYCGNANATTNSTPGTLTLSGVFASVPGVTTITPWTVVSGTTTGSAIVAVNYCLTITTAATGATGTLEVHGWAQFDLTGAGIGVEAQDFIYTVSSTVNLTAADQLSFTLTPTTTGTTAAQLRQLTMTQQQ